MKVKAMIFAAGLGTRFKPWTDSHPKALAPVNGKSLLQRNILFLQKHGIDEVVVNVHHYSDQIIREVEAAGGWGSKVLISDETTEVLETGGGLLKALPMLAGADLVLTMNADILTTLNLPDFIRYHFEKKSLISLAVMERPSSRVLLFDQKNLLCGWRNKEKNETRISRHDEQLSELAFSGISLFSKSALEKIRYQGKFSLLDVFLDLSSSEQLAGFNHTGDAFIDVGKPGSAEQAALLFN
jgi:MurNAc alpha-1-phosphate uridylyltransferase